jgi:hypothetical protein
METTHKPQHLDKLSLVKQKIMATQTSLLIVILFDDSFKYCDGAKFWDYVGANVKQHCIQIYKFVQCNILTLYIRPVSICTTVLTISNDAFCIYEFVWFSV